MDFKNFLWGEGEGFTTSGLYIFHFNPGWVFIIIFWWWGLFGVVALLFWAPRGLRCMYVLRATYVHVLMTIVVWLGQFLNLPN